MTTSFPLDLQTDLEIAGAWQAATSLVYQRDGGSPPVTIGRGRPDEMTKQPTAATSAFEVNNRGGQFSPKNPLGAWYGQFGHNATVRHSIPAQAAYLRLEAGDDDRMYVNDVAALHVTGSIEMRIQLDPSDWQGCVLAAKWDGGGCWYWAIGPDGSLVFSWTDSSSVQHSVTSAPVFWRGSQALRVTMDATTGSVSFYQAATIDGTYAQAGTTASGTGGAATSILSSAGSALVVGWSENGGAFTPPVGQLLGRVAEYRLYNGIGGTVVADTVMSGVTAGATTWTDSAGLTWLLAGGAEVSSRDYRFHGECAELPPVWDVTGADQSVKVTASGPLRRLGQGQTPAQSPLRRALTTQAGALAPVAYWPWEDSAGAAALGSAAAGGVPMQFDGHPTLATDSSFLGSMPLPQLNGGRFTGQVPPYSGAGAVVARFLMKLGTAPSSTTTLVRLVTSGTVPVIDMQVTSGGLITLASSGGAFSVGPLASPTGGGSWSGQEWWMSIELTPSGSNVDVAVVSLAPDGGTAYGTIYTSYAGAAGNAGNVCVNPYGGFSDTVMGHFSVQASWETMFNLQQPLDAFNGELAALRYPRVCAEEGVACRVIGPPAYSAAMGPQPVDTVLNILQGCEDADRGLQFEPRQVLGLGYRTLASMCNQAPRVTVNYGQAQLGGTTGGDDTGLRPTLDDQQLRNDWTVTRGSASGSQGMTYQYQLDDGSPASTGVAGDYSDSLTANLEYDSQVPDVTGWLVHAGTADEYRWPAIPFNLRRPAIQSASLYYPLLGLDVGDHLELAGIPDVVLYDPVKQLAWGFTESLGGFHHQAELQCVPESTYEVIVLDDPVYGRADTDGSALAAAVSPTAVTLQVAVTGPSGILWTTASGDWPFDVAISGERVTVTAVAAAAALSLGTDDGTFESGVSQWSPSGGTLAQSTAHAHSGTHSALLTVAGTPAQAYFRNDDAVPVAPGAEYTASMWLYGASITNCGAAIDWRDAAGGYLSTSAGADGTATTTWAQFAVTDTAPAGAAYAVYGPTIGGNPENALQLWTDDVLLTTQAQALTATRSVNGVAKPQAAGADVRLWFPPILALA